MSRISLLPCLASYCRHAATCSFLLILLLVGRLPGQGDATTQRQEAGKLLEAGKLQKARGRLNAALGSCQQACDLYRRIASNASKDAAALREHASALDRLGE